MSPHRWLYCRDRCQAIAVLVRYGRRSLLDESIDEARLRRLESNAQLEGRLPPLRIRDAFLRDGRACEMCGADGARKVDFARDAMPLDATVRESDLRALCSMCHAAEARRRYVGPDGRVAPTAPSAWARMEAAEPLIPRDNVAWNDPPRMAQVRRMRSWPARSAETLLDLERWLSVLGEGPGDRVDDPGTDPLLDWMNEAIDRLKLRKRRTKRLVRAIRAMLETGLDDSTAGSVDGTDPMSPAPLRGRPVHDTGGLRALDGEDR